MPLSIASILIVGFVMLKKLRRRRLVRAPYVNHATEREHYINNILHGSETLCKSN